MKKKTVSGMMLTLLRLFFLLVLGTTLLNVVPVPIATSEATIYVSPYMSFAEPGERFNVTVEIKDALDVFSWGVNMSFDPSVLDFQDAWEGDFLKDQPEGTSGLFIGDFVGYVYMVVSTRGDYLGVTGRGALATVEFKAKEDVTGGTIINISDPGEWREDLGYHIGGTNILDHLEREIPRITVDGYFISTQLLPFYDQFLTLNSSFYSLLADYQDLLSKYDSLESDYASLNTTYTSLQSNHNTLSSTYDALCSDYSSLNSTHHSLQSDYDDLESKYTALTGDFSTITNLNYLLITATIVFIAATVYLALRKPKIKLEPKTP